MKNKLTKLYRLFSQINSLNNGNGTGWDQLEIFLNKYINNEYIICYQILYELVSENKNIDIRGFNVDLTIQEIRKYSGGVSLLFYPETGEICKTTPRNSNNKPTGKVIINDFSTDENEVLDFIDGINVSDVVLESKYDDSNVGVNASDSYLEEIDNYVDNDDSNNIDSDKTYKNWISILNSNSQKINDYNIKLNLILVKNNISIEFINVYLINIDNLTLQELMDLEYVEDRINVHLEDYDHNPGFTELSANGEVAQKIYFWLENIENPGSTQFYIISSKPIKNEDLTVDYIENYLNECTKSEYNTIPSFIRCEVINNMIYFYELHTKEEPNGNFKIEDFDGQGVFQYFPKTDSFVEIEGYIDERAEIVNGEDGWNCIDFIKNIINNDDYFEETYGNLIINTIGNKYYFKDTETRIDGEIILGNDKKSSGEIYKYVINIIETYGNNIDSENTERLEKFIESNLHLILKQDEIKFEYTMFVDNDSIFNNDENLDKLDFVSLTNSEAESRVYTGKDVSYHDDNDELITINTPEQFEATKLLFNDERFFYFPKSLEIFRINGEIPESLESLEDVELFLNYLYDDCELIGVFHPDDSFSNYTDSEGAEIFTIAQQEKYTKYIEDMFELDADGDSEFVKAGYVDVYDYCMNYRNDNHGINEIYPIKLKYGNTYIRRDGKISGQLTQNVDENGKTVQIFHDSDNGLDYHPNGRLVSGEYNSKNPEDLIYENIDFNIVSYEEDGYLSVGIKYNGSNNIGGFDSDEQGVYFKYIQINKGDSISYPEYNDLKIEWVKKTQSWLISTNNGYSDEVFGL